MNLRVIIWNKKSFLIIDILVFCILAGHAYSILDVFEIPKPRGKKRRVSRLLRIRNPWGRKEWNRKWSDDSVETKKIRKE